MNSGINIATMIVMALTVAVIVFTIDHLIGGLLWGKYNLNIGCMY